MEAITATNTASCKQLKSQLQSRTAPGLGPTRHTFRRVADEASKAETALSGSVITNLSELFLRF